PPRPRWTDGRSRTARGSRPLTAFPDGPPHALRRAGHGYVAHAERAQRVHDRVDHGRGRRDGAGLADTLDAQRVAGCRGLGPVGDQVGHVRRAGYQVVHEGTGEQVAVGVVDGLLVQRLGDALDNAAVHLALDD